MYVQLSDENRILGTAEYDCFPDDLKKIEFDFPEGFNFDEQYEYLIVDGELVESESELSKKSEEPTQADRIEAQCMYTALMTDTLLESEGE